jgi:hypothetical protein
MQQLSILMYKVKNKLVPDYLYDMFTNVGDVHDHNARQSGADLTLPKPKTNSRKNEFSYRGAEVWNCLSASAKASTRQQCKLTSSDSAIVSIYLK